MPDLDRKGIWYSERSSRTSSCWVAFSSLCSWLSNSPTSPWTCLGSKIRALLASQWHSLDWCFIKAVFASFHYVKPLLKKAAPHLVLTKNFPSWSAPSYTGGRRLSRSRCCSAATDNVHTTLLLMTSLHSSCQMRTWEAWTIYPGETFLEAQKAMSMSNATRMPFSSHFHGTAHRTIIWYAPFCLHFRTQDGVMVRYI